MKLLLSTGCLCALVMAGCGLIRQPPDDRVPNVLMVNTYSDIAIDNAILAQHTLYPYHFVSDAAVLNELGKRDLGVLAAHYKDYPGTLNVSRSDVPQPLYAARLAEVRKALMEAGVKEQRMTITDGLAGGDGMKSEQVVKILEREEKRESETGTASSSTTPIGQPSSGQPSSGYSGQMLGQ